QAAKRLCGWLAGSAIAYQGTAFPEHQHSGRDQKDCEGLQDPAFKATATEGRGRMSYLTFPHEAAHAVSFFEGGIVVESLTASRSAGGVCLFRSSDVPAEIRLRSALAGAASAQLFGVDDFTPSYTDREIAMEAAAELGLCSDPLSLARQRRYAEYFVW